MEGFASLTHRLRRIPITEPSAAGTNRISYLNLATGRVVRFAGVMALAAAIAFFPAFAQTQDDNSPTSTQAIEQKDQAVDRADQAADRDDRTVKEPVREEAGKEVEQKRDKLIADAVAALDETKAALAALDEGDTQKALDSLALATGKLELIIARNPELALAPVDVNLITLDVLHDVEEIKASREDIEEAFEAGDIQKARAMIRGFGSELVVATSNLPLGTYPEAIKIAAAMIDEGNVDGAKQALRTALSTLIVTETVIPLPVVRARLLLEKAEEGLKNVAESPKTADDKVAENVANEDAEAAEDSETMQPADYVEAARKQLAMAEALGYGTAEEHKDLRDNLKELEEKVGTGEKTTGIFRTIADNIAKLRERLISSDEAGS